MADEEKRSEGAESEEAERDEDKRPEGAAGAASDEPKKDDAEGAAAKESKDPENQPESITQLTGVESTSPRPEEDSIPGSGPAGGAEDVAAASPVSPAPGMAQDSDSAAAAIKPATRLGEEHAGASEHGPHEYVAAFDEHGLSHTTPVKLLLAVFAALTVLTVLTVAVTAVDLGSQGNFIVAMIVATIKAILVMAFFMHMMWDSRFNAMIFLSSFLFVLLFLSLSLADRAEYQRAIDSWETSQLTEGS